MVQQGERGLPRAMPQEATTAVPLPWCQQASAGRTTGPCGGRVPVVEHSSGILHRPFAPVVPSLLVSRGAQWPASASADTQVPYMTWLPSTSAAPPICPAGDIEMHFPGQCRAASRTKGRPWAITLSAEAEAGAVRVCVWCTCRQGLHIAHNARRSQSQPASGQSPCPVCRPSAQTAPHWTLVHCRQHQAARGCPMQPPGPISCIALLVF